MNMSFSSEKRQQIKNYILEKISLNEKDFVKKTIENFGISRNTLYRYLRELKDEKKLVESENGYKLSTTHFFKNYSFEEDKENLASDYVIYERDIVPKLKDLPENVQRMWDYCFTEMMNNVIDHSEAENVLVSLDMDYLNTTIIIADDGIGIFRKIKENFHFATLNDAVLELFKGKLTTDSKHHSGEGIFFTSRILDEFAAISDDKIFSHSEFSEVYSDIDANKDMKKLKKNKAGTLIFMKLSNFSKRTCKGIMDEYASVDGGFTKTRIPIKNVFPNGAISRSQAKRLYARFDEFEEVELDFSGVEEIGQGFAHELFSVYGAEHKDVLLIPYNASLDVQKMIQHVTSAMS